LIVVSFYLNHQLTANFINIWIRSKKPLESYAQGFRLRLTHKYVSTRRCDLFIIIILSVTSPKGADSYVTYGVSHRIITLSAFPSNFKMQTFALSVIIRPIFYFS